MNALLVLLLAAAAAVPQGDASAARAAQGSTRPALPAPLAWLADQDDYPQVSRHLMVLEPGAEAAMTALDGLLYCFDAADHQRVAWCGDLLMVNGPRPRSRPTPNVAMPLHALRRAASGWQPLAPWQAGATPQHFAPSPIGDGVLIHSLQRVGFLPAGETRADAVQWLLTREQGLGRAQVRAVTWATDGSAAWVSVKNWGDDGPQDGLWRLDRRRGAAKGQAEGGADGASPSAFDPPVRVAETQGVPRVGWPGGGLLATRRNAGRDFYSVRSLLLVSPGSERKPRVLVDDLHWNEAFAVEPELLGRSDRLPGPPRVAYVRAHAEDGEHPGTHGAIVLRGSEADAAVRDRELWHGAREADGLAWSPDGRWLAFHARDEERKPWVWVLEVESGTAHRLGPGLRPAWGPLPREASALRDADGSGAQGADADGR